MLLVLFFQTIKVNRYLLLLEKMPDDKETMIALLTEYTHIGKAEAQTFVYSHVNMTETAVIYETEDSTEACRIRKAFEAAGAEISVFHAE